MEWISVKDRVPEKEGMYLFYHNDLRPYSCCCPPEIWIAWYNIEYNKFFRIDEYEFASEKVTHWMELPEKPKE